MYLQTYRNTTGIVIMPIHKASKIERECICVYMCAYVCIYVCVWDEKNTVMLVKWFVIVTIVLVTCCLIFGLAADSGRIRFITNIQSISLYNCFLLIFNFKSILKKLMINFRIFEWIDLPKSINDSPKSINLNSVKCALIASIDHPESILRSRIEIITIFVWRTQWKKCLMPFFGSSCSCSWT